MPIKILMPALSPTMTEGNLARWIKKEGDEVASGDILAEIETDKATMEVEAADDGTLGRILVPDGSEGVKVNAVIGMLLEEGEDASALDEVKAETEAEAAPAPRTEEAPSRKAAEPAKGKAPAETGGKAEATPLARRIAEQAGIDLGGMKGTGDHGRITRADVEKAISGTGADRQVRAAEGEEAGRIFASPLARRMAEKEGLDLAAIEGSGPEGRVIKADIEAALDAPRPGAAKAPAAAEGDAFDIAPMSTMRKVIAERMTHSKSTVPHFYLTVDCEIDELLRVRKALNERGEKSGV